MSSPVNKEDLARLKRHRDELKGVLAYSDRFDGALSWAPGEKRGLQLRIQELNKDIERMEIQLAEPKPTLDEEEARMLNEMIETGEDLHRHGRMSDEKLNEMKRIGGRL